MFGSTHGICGFDTPNHPSEVHVSVASSQSPHDLISSAHPSYLVGGIFDVFSVASITGAETKVQPAPHLDSILTAVPKAALQSGVASTSVAVPSQSGGTVACLAVNVHPAGQSAVVLKSSNPV